MALNVSETLLLVAAFLMGLRAFIRAEAYFRFVFAILMDERFEQKAFEQISLQKIPCPVRSRSW